MTRLLPHSRSAGRFLAAPEDFAMFDQFEWLDWEGDWDGE